MTRTVFLRRLAFLAVVALTLGALTPGIINARSMMQSPVALSAEASNVQLSSSSPSGWAAPTGPDGGGIKASPAYTVTLGAWRNLRPTESYLRDVSMLPSSYPVNCSSPDQKSKGWIVGGDGVILSYCNGVWDHAIIVESESTDLFGVQAISPTLGVAVGEQGAVLMYLWDYVANDWVWTKSHIPVGNQTLYNVSMVPDGAGGYTGWAVGDKNASTGRGTLVQGTIFPKIVSGTLTYGYSWSNRTGDYPDLPQVDFYFGVQMLSPTNGWATGGTGGINGKGVILHWDGETWSVYQEVGTQALLGLYMISATDGWVVGYGGVIYHFNGSTWSPVASPTSEILASVSFASNGEGWAVGFNGTLLKYTDGTWVPAPIVHSDPFDYYALDFTSGHGWLVGFHLSKGIGGHILEYDNGAWWAVTPPTDNRLNAVSIVSDNDAWAVGAADSVGGTILHWDGKHWARWYQRDLPLPAIDLYAIEMTSATDGWAAGDPPVAGAPALFLHWDGYRWAQPRYDAPVNVRVNDISMLNSMFGWAVADTGNAVAKYDGVSGYWSANHTCGGYYYQLFGTSIVTATNAPGWDAWAISANKPVAHFLRFIAGCAGSSAWQPVQSPIACPPPKPEDPWPTDGPTATTLRDIRMQPGPWGFAAGNYYERASIYRYVGGAWQTYFCTAFDSPSNPSRFYSVDIVKASGVSWFGGYYTERPSGRLVAYIAYLDGYGFGWGSVPFPLNGKNYYHRPISNLRMSSDTMGWAVGDNQDSRNLSVIYQYPYPNFTLNTSPVAQAVLPGGATSFTVTANSLGGFSADISLSLLDWPSSITYTIAPPTANAQTMATIYITTSAGTPLDTYYLPLQGYATFRSGDNEIPVWRVSNLKLTVTNHPVYDIAPTHGPANTIVTISGAGFGTDPGVGNRSTATNHITWGCKSIPDSNVLSWSNGTITFMPPDSPSLYNSNQPPCPKDFPFAYNVSVTADSTQSNDDYLFKMDNFINTLSTVRGSSAITVTLQGTSLGADPGSLFRSTYYEHVSVNGTWIPNNAVKAWSNTAITFTVPVTSTGGLVLVTSNGFESNAKPLQITPGTGPRVFLPTILK